MRSVPEWIGRDDDAPVPQRVRIRVYVAKGGLCHKCRRKIGPADKWTCEHVIAIANLGPNRESNLDLTCSWCLPIKNAEDVAIKSKVAALKARHLGLRKKSRLTNPHFRKKVSGEVVPR